MGLGVSAISQPGWEGNMKEPIKIKNRDFFEDKCDGCGDTLTERGLRYLVSEKYNFCGDCMESTEVFLLDLNVHEDTCMCLDCLENFTPKTEPDEEDKQIKMIENNQCPCCSKQLTEGCCIECGEVYE